MGEKTKIQHLYEQGYIREKCHISFLTKQLNTGNPQTCELAARTIIEEVLGSKHSRLRLKALETLLRLPRRAPPTDSSSRGQIDLHTHSACFDGYQTPTALLLEAFERGLEAVAITDHNKSPFDDNVEAERAAEKLGLCFYKGSEISADFHSDVTHYLETVHLLEIPAHPPKSPVALLKRYTRDFTRLGVLSDIFFPLVRKYALIYTDNCTKRQIEAMLGKFASRYGDDLELSHQDLVRVCRGDLPIPFTIALALWTKYREKLVGGVQISAPEGVKTIEPLDNPNEVYRYFLTNPNGGRTRKMRKGPPPDLPAMGQLALILDHKLILAHPNEYPLDLFEEAIEKAALVRMEGGGQYAGVFVGVEYYSHKLQGDWKEYVRQHVDWLNKVHPVYKNCPLHFFPGSDTHGKFSPDRAMGLDSNYPANKDAYNEELREVLVTKPKQLKREELDRLESELVTWKQLREQRPSALEELRSKVR